jgi:TetR/AcrR family transcriptional regulator, transcriptional repressor for nem operon
MDRRQGSQEEAGFTHGGFYGHFSSKEDLIAEASAGALMRSLAP